MDWRDLFLRHCGPGVLSGITLQDWVNLLGTGDVVFDWTSLPRIISITAQSSKNSLLWSIERRRYEPLLKTVVVQPPIFVLGHWRSGTTHLHQLLSQDDRFAFPNSYQVSFPHSFLSSEAFDARWLSFFIPRRRPMDNMAMSLASPQEDEFALCSSTLKSPCMAWVFPRQREKFGQYLTFRTATGGDLAEWQEAFMRFVRKVQLRYGRPLLLKSPPHTARIRLLLELFPGARFVHIHRNPYRVFQSSRQLFLTMFAWHGVQRPRLDDLDDWILRQYKEMYEAFFEERKLIPIGRFHDMGFEQLELDPIGEMRKLYEALALPDYSRVEPALVRYVNSLANYRKNAFPDLSAELRARIASTWKNCFEEWGYSVTSS